MLHHSPEKLFLSLWMSFLPGNSTRLFFFSEREREKKKHNFNSPPTPWRRMKLQPIFQGLLRGFFHSFLFISFFLSLSVFAKHSEINFFILFPYLPLNTRITIVYSCTFPLFFLFTMLTASLFSCFFLLNSFCFFLTRFSLLVNHPPVRTGKAR